MASIRERESRAGELTFAVLYRHGKRQTSMTFTSSKEAEDFKALVDVLGPDRALAALGTEEGDDRLTVSELAAEWLAWKESRVTGRTMTDYRRDVANWIEPWFGHRAAELVTEGDVQKWVDHMAAKPLAPKTVADRHMLLHSMFDYGKARSRRLVTHNPCDETELPPRVKKPPKGTTVAEFRALLEAAGRRNPDARDLILFLGETGWRFSEATALDMRDVEDDGIDMWVTVTQVFRTDGQGRRVIVEDAAKSYAAFRRIRMFPETAAMIRRRVVGKGPGDLLLTNSRGRHWNQDTFLKETWPRIRDDAKLGNRKPTPHWLRHMHVAVCFAAGAQPQEVQRRIGHDNIATTVGVYGGMVGDLNDNAMDRAGEIMSGQRFAPGVAPVVRGEVVAQVLELT